MKKALFISLWIVASLLSTKLPAAFVQSDYATTMRQLQDSLLMINTYDSLSRNILYRKLITISKEANDYRNHINHLTEYGKIHIGITPDYEKAYYYLDLAENLAIKHNYTQGMAKAFLFKAYYYHLFNEPQLTINYIQKSKAQYRKVEKEEGNIISKSSMYLLIADMYKVFNMFDSSLYNYNVALNESIKRSSTDSQMKAELGIASLLENIKGDYQTSAGIYQRILSTDASDSSFMSIAARKLAEIMVMQEETDSAKNLLKLSYRINSSRRSPLAFIASSLADIYSAEGKPDSALYYLGKAEHFPHTDIGLLHMDLGYGYAYMAANDYELALYYNDRALEKTKNKPENNLVREALNQRIRIATSNEDFEMAYQVLEKLKSWEDSIMNFDKQKDLLELEAKFESEVAMRELRRKSEIRQLELKQQNLQLAIVSVILISLLLISYLIYNRRLIRQDQKTNELNQKLLRLQLNPHFIFNALASIQSFIMTNNTRDASLSLAKFGELTRDILDTSNEALIPLEKEIKMLQNYVDIQRTRFEQEIYFQIDIDEKIDQSFVLIPPMFIQPFIENAIEHGLSRKKGGKIALKIRQKDKALVITITDDGGGLIKERPKTHESMAISVIRKRLEKLNPASKKLKPLIIKDRLENGAVVGVMVTFELPLIYH